MDDKCKQAFLIVIIIPFAFILIAGWIFMGGNTIHGGFTQGYLDGISIMWIPTIFAFAVGGIIDRVFFNGEVMSCLKKRIKN